MMNHLNTEELKKTKKQLQSMMDGLKPIMDRVTGNLTPHLEKLMQDEIESEKKVKIKKKAAKMKLLKNGNIVLEFDNKEDSKWFFNNIK